VDLDAMVDYFAARTEPVSPDLEQRAIGVSWVSDPTAPLAPGDEIALDLSSLAFSNDEPKPTEVTATLGGVELGSYAVDTSIVDTTDEAGRASVVATVPDGLGGEVELVVSDDVNGVVYTTTLVVEDEAPDTTRPETTLVAPTSAGPFRTLTIQWTPPTTSDWLGSWRTSTAAPPWSAARRPRWTAPRRRRTRRPSAVCWTASTRSGTTPTTWRATCRGRRRST